MRKGFMIFAVCGVIANIALGLVWLPGLYGLVVLLPIIAVGMHDMMQTHHSIRRNFPILGRARWMLESIDQRFNKTLLKATRTVDLLAVKGDHSFTNAQKMKYRLCRSARRWMFMQPVMNG
jgi:hypothetical protein